MLSRGVVCKRHCRAELRKQVFPVLCSPTPILNPRGHAAGILSNAESAGRDGVGLGVGAAVRDAGESSSGGWTWSWMASQARAGGAWAVTRTFEVEATGCSFMGL